MELLILTTIAHLSLPHDYLLYIDPGSGSMLFQILIAGLVGCLYAVKTFWTRLLTFFKKLAGKNPTGETENIE